MALDMSTWLANKLLDHVLRGDVYTPPADVWLSLHFADPGDTGASEVAGGSYARLASAWSAAGSGASTTTSSLTFLDMPSVEVTHLAAWDAETGGHFLFRITPTAPAAYTAGQDAFVAVGGLDATMS